MSVRRTTGRAATWRTSPRGALSKCGTLSPTTSATPYRRGNRSSSWAVPSRTPGWARTASCAAKSLWQRVPWATTCRRAAPRSSGHPTVHPRCRRRVERNGRTDRRPPTARDNGERQPPPVHWPLEQRTTRAHQWNEARLRCGRARPGPEGPVPPMKERTRGGVRACPTTRRQTARRTRETARGGAPPTETGGRARGRVRPGWSTPVQRTSSLARPLRTAVIRAAAWSPRGNRRAPAVRSGTAALSQRTPQAGRWQSGRGESRPRRGRWQSGRSESRPRRGRRQPPPPPGSAHRRRDQPMRTSAIA